VLGQFSRQRVKAEKEYRKFVSWGIGQKTIWTEVRGQALLGEDDFVDKLVDHLRNHQDVLEIPRSQRYATRPLLTVLLPEGIVSDQRKLKRKLSEAVEKHGYRQSEIARQVGVHYSTISRWLREDENARRKT
jgi:transcriptional regulator with AAA-type ATPase domain